MNRRKALNASKLLLVRIFTTATIVAAVMLSSVLLTGQTSGTLGTR